MKTTKTLILSIISLFVFLSFTKTIDNNKVIIGNWVCKKDLIDLNENDTISFLKKKYNYDLYTWGKYPSGIEFNSDFTFKEHHNVMCSTESNTVTYTNEKYSIDKDNIIHIAGGLRNLKYKIIKLSTATLTLQLLK